jgi:hypothetical protein
MTGTRCVFREHDRKACTIKHGLDPRRAFLMAAALHCERLEMTDRRGDCSTDSRRQRGHDAYEEVNFGVEIHRPVHRLRGCKIEGVLRLRAVDRDDQDMDVTLGQNTFTHFVILRRLH